jgi:hypothetical protein
MEFERDTLTQVIEARARAVSATGPADSARKEGELSQALGRLSTRKRFMRQRSPGRGGRFGAVTTSSKGSAIPHVHPRSPPSPSTAPSTRTAHLRFELFQPR